MRPEDSGKRSRVRRLVTLGLGLSVAASVVALRSAAPEAAPRSEPVAAREAEAPAPRGAPPAAPRPEPAVVEARATQQADADATLDGPAAAVDSDAVAAEPSVPDPPRFTSAEEERRFLVERLPGERLTLTNQGKALERMERVLDLGADLGDGELERLRERRERLKAKHELQARRVAGLERRIGEVSAN